MARREGTLNFTFSKKNWDVKELLDKKLLLDPNFVKTDYMCEAVRFYEANKDKKCDEAEINRRVNERIGEMFQKGLLSPQAIVSQQPITQQEQPKEESDKSNILKLGLDMDFSNCDESMYQED